MKTYVVGLMFSDSLEVVALIRKSKPVWQAGKLNGIGGKIEMDETPIQAMTREFQEETGLETLPQQWRPFLTMAGNENGDNGRVDGSFAVHFFCANGPLGKLKSVTDEIVEKHSVKDICGFNHATLENIPWVVALAVDVMHDGRPHAVMAHYP